MFFVFCLHFFMRKLPILQQLSSNLLLLKYRDRLIWVYCEHSKEENVDQIVAAHTNRVDEVDLLDQGLTRQVLVERREHILEFEQDERVTFEYRPVGRLTQKFSSILKGTANFNRRKEIQKSWPTEEELLIGD